MNTFFPNNKNKNGPVTIRRTGEAELLKAIAELEKRGYELVRRGVDQSSDMGYEFRKAEHLTSNLNASRKMTLDPSETIKLYAVMKKVNI